MMVTWLAAFLAWAAKSALDTDWWNVCFDTGAFHSVAPRGIFPGPITSSPMSRAGKEYRGPDSSRIPIMGQLDGRWLDELGAPCAPTLTAH